MRKSQCIINPTGYNQCPNSADYVSIYNIKDVQCKFHYKTMLKDDSLDYIQINGSIEKCCKKSCIALGSWESKNQSFTLDESYLCSIHLNKYPEIIRRMYVRTM
jgi:hypothetical protein